MKKWFLKYRGFRNKVTQVNMILLVIAFAVAFFVSLFIGWQYIPVFAFMGLIIYFSKQASSEGEGVQNPREVEKKQKEIEGLEKKISVMEDHILANPADLDAKLKLIDLQQEKELFENLVQK